MDTRPKRAYQKPTIERINLIGEQTTAAVAACKRTTGGGKNMTFPSACRTTGAVGLLCRTSRGS